MRPDDRPLPGAGRHDPKDRPRLPGRHAAAQRAEFPGRRAAGPQRQARQAPHAVRLGLHAVDRNDLAPGRADAAARRGRLGPVARAGPLAALQPAYVERQVARLLGLRLRRPGCSTGARTPSTSASGPTRPTTPCPSSTSRPGQTITARYANGVKLVLDFLKTPFGERPGWVQPLGTCPVRFVGDEGWVETGDSGGIEVHPASLKAELKEVTAKRAGRAGRLRPTPATSSTASSRGRDRRPTPQVMRHSHIACHAAALSWILNRKLKFDPAKEEFVGDDEANGLRSRPLRAPWAV